jgi:hypothetical protein
MQIQEYLGILLEYPKMDKHKYYKNALKGVQNDT